jgi:hypothetical protein
VALIPQANYTDCATVQKGTTVYKVYIIFRRLKLEGTTHSLWILNASSDANLISPVRDTFHQQTRTQQREGGFNHLMGYFRTASVV